MEEALLEIKNGIKKFSGRKILDGIDFSMNKGDFLGIVGGSGSGKTTLLKVIVGYHKLDSGKIHFNGKDVTRKTSIIKKKVGYCTQENSFYPGLSIKENMYYYGRMYGLWGKRLKKRVSELLSLVELDGYEDNLAKNVSGGMKRRLDLAISLLHDPEIIVFDEPTTGLDPFLRKKIWMLMKRINEEGKTLIVISHFLNMVNEYCNKVAILKDGRITHLKSPEQFRKEYGDVKTFEEIFEGIIR
ncbi:hypothetical protein COV19_03630 [Candidatus Woesearchaeota archaeon CG10_big_fil_rev_8_21_14_0_10_44_13]|nr:MAG: hypothetical protein COV19_03630 [Candidatus Woesearchaeota archaeon CG10_big_fil_rev_8_21_14_0_10_44_13]